MGNTAPGLELDERSIEKYFFPGLVFEFQWNGFADKPLLREIKPDELESDLGLSATDVLGSGGTAVLPRVRSLSARRSAR